jgi:eukaryotic-like serine/threonine-protein kinase
MTAPTRRHHAFPHLPSTFDPLPSAFFFAPAPMTKTERTCSRCGLVFASDKLDGLCPSCLLNSLFEDEDPGDTQAFWEEETQTPFTSGAADKPGSPPLRRFSHFEILEELGRGGMGIVYRARDIGTGRIVALKVLQAHHLEVPDLIQRFRAEVRAVTSLDHPHVLPVHEVGEYEGIPFFSMKLTTGGSLAQRLGDYLGKPRDIARLMADIARGVAHAHERGILHRDLKPANILLDAAGQPYVCDFGLAKWLEDDRNLTLTSAVFGTPHYIAPEQASGQKGLTTAADIYSLGSILYELLTARPPFVGQSIIETLRLASEQTPERPSSLVENIPRDLETICLKCLQREPAARYPSAAALAADLDNWLEGRPILARPVSAGEQLWRWAKRNPLPAALVASVFILLTATATVAILSNVKIRAAQTLAREQLYESLLAQAKASLLTGQAGHSLNALAAVKEAHAIHPGPDVRALAIRALSLTDLEVEKSTYPIGPNSRPTRAFDPSLTRMAEEVDKGVIRILALKSGAEGPVVAEFSEAESGASPIDIIRYSPDGTAVAARHTDGIVRVWDLSTKTKRFQLAGAAIPKAPWYAPNFAFSADATRLVCARPEGGVAVYDARSGELLTTMPLEWVVRCAAFSPDGKSLALAAYDRAQLDIREIATGLIRCSMEIPSQTYTVAWSPDGRELAAGAFDGSINLFETRQGRRTGSFTGHRQEVTQVLFTPAGDRLISTSLDKTIRLWSLSALAQEVYLPSYGSEPAMCFSADGARFATTAAASTASVVRIHDASPVVKTGVNGRPFGRATLVGGIAFSPDGELIATATYEGIDLWNARTGRILGTYDIDPNAEKSVRFYRDASTLLVGSRTSGLVEYGITTEPDGVKIFPRRTLDAEPGFIFSNSPPGDRDLVGMSSPKAGVARVFDLKTGKDRLRLEGLPEVWDVAISPDERLVSLSFSPQATTEKANTQIRSLDDGRIVFEMPGGQYGTARFSPKSTIVNVSGRGQADGTWDAIEWKKLSIHFDGNYSVFSESNWVAGSVFDNVFVWSLSGKLMYTLESPLLGGTAFRLAIAPHTTRLAAHSSNNTLILWSLTDLETRLRQNKL